MENQRFSWQPVVRTSLMLVVLCGGVYPAVTTALAQVAFHDKAEGSLLYDKQGQVVGSEWIGQSFTEPGYFHGRVSSISYDAAGSGTPNYAPSSPDLIARTAASLKAWEEQNPSVPVADVPIDLVTNSGSGLDPHITPQAAEVQIPRVAEATGLPVAILTDLVETHTEGRSLGLIGEPRVNVVLLNQALQDALQ